MCGILGTINLPFEKSTLDLLRHRGPDGQGLTEQRCGAHQVKLGHRRLAIVDLSEHGAQPMATSDGGRHLVFNGEIYNHLDLRSGLDVPFRGHSDTETLLELLAKHGIQAVRRLNGIFGLAYLDQHNRKLYLARDPFGVKPVYYSAQPDRFCFSSEIMPLRAMVDDSLDSEALASLLKLRFVPSPRTLYKGIRRLRPGHILEVDLGGTNLSWKEVPFIGPVSAEDRKHPRFSDAVEEYGRLFNQAVSRQLMADVEVGVLLSGGIDSALVASSAQRASDYPLKAFTVGFTDEDAGDVDEIAAAAETARFLGLEHHVTRIGFDDFLKTLRECVRIVEEPLATTSIVPMHFLAKLAGSQVKVVMSGQGADELLGGYNRYQVELWRRFVPAPLARAGSRVVSSLGIRNDTLARGLRALAENDELSRFLAAYEVFSDEEISRLTGIDAGPSREDIGYFHALLGCRQLPSSVERMMAIDGRLGLADDLLLYTDKITMRESLECRVPILDLELVSFIESLPANYRLRLGRTKIVHSAFAMRTLQQRIVNRPKRGFMSPTRSWFSNAKPLRRLLLDSISGFTRYFDSDAVDGILRQHEKGFNRERQIFLLLSLYYCLETQSQGGWSMKERVHQSEA
jgi:asparagine synthase (glutamine-hydrolysing)